MERDPYSFIVTANVALDVGLEIVASGSPIEDDPALKHVGFPSSEDDKGLSPSFAKPLRAPRLKRRNR